MVDQQFFTRDEVLGGLPAKRAQALLFLIESRTAKVVVRARQAAAQFLTEETARDRDLAFVEAFALGREPPIRITVQDLERFASAWADLVPANPRLRAAVAHLLAQKYPFTASAAPRLHAALGLDQPAVQAAYQRLYGAPLTTLYAPKENLQTRLRWAKARAADWLESLPPFWTAFALTLTETVGQSILALPIALAGVGALPGIAILIVLGLVNVVTVAALAEAMTRTASVRYGQAFFRRVVADYLGGAGSALLTWSLVSVLAIGVVGFYLGIGTTLNQATGVPAALWMAIIFIIDLVMATRESLSSTVASALAIGTVNLCLLAVLVALASPSVQVANLKHVTLPWLNGQPFDRSLLGLIFGVVLIAYFGHTSIGNCAKVVLHRDPSGRSLLWGAVAAQLTAIVVYTIWVLAVNGALSPAQLLGQTAPAVVPLAEHIGPSISVLGSIFVLLSMGMSSVHCSLGLFNSVRDWLPRRTRPVVLLPRQGARLLLHPRGAPATQPYLALTYVGLDGKLPRFALDLPGMRPPYHAEITVSGIWRAGESLADFPGFAGRPLDLVLNVIDATAREARLQVITSLGLTYDGEWNISGIDLSRSPAQLGADWPLLHWMMRQGSVSASETAAETGEALAAATARLRGLVERGLVREIDRDGERHYRAHFASRRRRQLSDELWSALGQPAASPAQSSQDETGLSRLRQWLGQGLLHERSRVAIGISPVVAVFLLAEWLQATNRASFTKVLSFGGLVSASVFVGVFSTLLLIASRRRGDLLPGVVYRWLGHPVLIVTIYVLFLGGIFLHGLVIWSGTLERACALIMGVSALIVVIVSIRQGAFARRLVLTIREDHTSPLPVAFDIVSAGEPLTGQVQLDTADGAKPGRASSGRLPALTSLRSLRFIIPTNGVRDLKVVALRLLPDGEVESLPQQWRITSGTTAERVNPSLADGQAIVPLAPAAPNVEIMLAEVESR